MKKTLLLLPIIAMLGLAGCTSQKGSSAAPSSTTPSSSQPSSTTPSSSGETTNYGTAENPLTVAQALAICDAELEESGDWTKQQVFVRGLIVNTPANKGTYSQSTKIADTVDGTQLLVYTMNHDEDKAPYQNDTIVVKGYITLYGSTIEFSNKDSDYPTQLSVTRGTSQISYTAVDAGITFGGDKPATGTNGANFSFTVAKEDAGKNVIVKVNNEVVEPTAGVYTGVVKGNTAVSAEYEVTFEHVDVAYAAGSGTTNMAVDTNEAAKFGLDANNWGVFGIKNDANNNVGLNNAGNLRLYNCYSDQDGKTIGNGNTLKIQAKAAGVVIKRIVIELAATTAADLTKTVVKAGETTLSGEAGVYAVNDAEFVTIQNASLATKGDQLHIQKVTVYYA